MMKALEHLPAIVGHERPALFLDFDGTLVDIAPRPTQVVFPRSVRDALVQLTAHGIPVALVSGRDLQDLRTRVDVPTLAYAGSHGFDLLGPPPDCVRHQPGADFLPALDAVEAALHARLRSVEGVFMERKRFAFAVHYRQVSPDGVPQVVQAVRTTVALHPGVQVREGKMVLEMVPDLKWDKGEAVLWLLQRTQVKGTPIYIGDDVTDEDAFRALEGRGVGIVVQEAPAPSAASYRLRNPGEVEQFLWRLAQRFGP